jgi:MarR family transcriptional regulator, organic hydroperoxide resistance regulator
MTKLYKPLLAPLGLTYPQYLVMLVLWAAGTVSACAARLGERLALDSGTLTPLLKRLESGRPDQRLRDADDERRVRLRRSRPPAVRCASAQRPCRRHRCRQRLRPSAKIGR